MQVLIKRLGPTRPKGINTRVSIQENMVLDGRSIVMYTYSLLLLVQNINHQYIEVVFWCVVYIVVGLLLHYLHVCLHELKGQ